jgi:hypothetical protein
MYQIPNLTSYFYHSIIFPKGVKHIVSSLRFASLTHDIDTFLRYYFLCPSLLVILALFLSVQVHSIFYEYEQHVQIHNICHESGRKLE